MAVGRIPLAAPAGEREPGDAKDPLLKNCYKETVNEQSGAPMGDATRDTSQKVVYVQKRPGLKSYDDLSAATTDTARGVTTWEGRVYTVLGDEIFSGETDLGQLQTSSGRLHFDVAIDAEAPSENVLVFQDGTNIYFVDDENNIEYAAQDGADIDIENLPASMVPGIVVLDQYVFVMDSAGTIYNSTVGDVTAGYSDTVVLEMRLDDGVRIIRYINYLIGFGEKTIEILYDAANPTGSPLTRFEGMGQLIGCASANTVANCENRVAFVAQGEASGRYVGMFDKGFAIDRISTQAIDEILDKEGTNLANAYAYHMRVGGHDLYVLTLPTTAQRTFVYDFDEKDWYEWTSDVSDTESYFTGYDSCALDGTTIVLDEDNGLLYDLDTETYQDNTGSAQTIKVEIRTRKHDMGTMQNKFMWRLQAIGDLNSSSGTISIEWSDDDYQTWSTARNQDLDNHQSWLTRCGMFKRRAFRIKHQQNLPMRLSHLEANGSTGHYGAS